MDKDVTNVNEASEAVAKRIPGQVTLGDGTLVTVRDLYWGDFESMFAAVAEPIQLYLEWQQSQEQAHETTLGRMVVQQQSESEQSIDDGDVEKADAKVKKAFAALAQRIIEAPRVVSLLVSKTTDYTEAKQKKLPFGDVMALSMESLKVNFIENKAVLGFFEGWTSAISGSPKGKTQSPEKKVDE